MREGEKRRTALAFIIAAGPSVLLLDEPTLGQDRENLIKMIVALREYNRKKGLTVITVTYEEAAALALGDRTLLFQNCTIKESKDDSLFVQYFNGIEKIPAVNFSP